MKPEKMENSQIRNLQRRNFLKYALFAIGGFLVGKLLDSLQNLFFTKKPELTNFETPPLSKEQTKIFENFIVKESSKEVRFLDKEGEEIFIIEK